MNLGIPIVLKEDTYIEENFEHIADRIEKQQSELV